ncbi:CD99 molecule isoform X2 [Eucyclogobius newberryi]|uniref:CD99 molecule isoform X2 n=1 Tax=Eucyclogobius newberryi TaxID=166745 RepID=UPI003B5B8D7C
MKLFFRIACLLFLLSGTLADDFGLDLADALDDDSAPPKATDPPKKNDDFGLDLSDALGGDDPVTPKPAVVKPPSGGGGGGTIKDTDLFDVSGGSYEPDGGKYEGGGTEPDYGSNSGGGGGEQPQDADFEWGPLLKMINANVPEEFFLWMSSVRQKMAPVLERVLGLLNALPEEDKQEL